MDFLPDITPWQLAEKFGWTLEYIDSLSLAALEEYEQYVQTVDGLQKGYAYLRRTNKAPKG